MVNGQWSMVNGLAVKEVFFVYYGIM